MTSPINSKTDYIAEAISEAFGDRCPDFAEGCACCEAWAQYDELVSCLRETLAVATRNEEGDFADRARTVLSKATGEGR